MSTVIGRIIVMSACVLLSASTVGCITSSIHLEQQRSFGQQLAVTSPHDEDGGRFDGARVSPGFGVLYLNGFTAETTEREACDGYFGDEPEHVLEVDSAMAFKVVVQTDVEVVLAVTDPEGDWTCWDVDSTSNANVSLEQTYTPGRYEVWVGPRHRHTIVSYRLVLSE